MFRDNNATKSSFYAHCFDVSRWSRETFCFDFTLMIKLRLVQAWSCCCNVGGELHTYIKPAVKPSSFILGMKQRICGIDFPKEHGDHDLGISR